VLLVQALHEAADLIAHDPRQRDLLGRDDVDLDFPRAQRRGDFQSDESRADDAGALPLFGEGNQARLSAAVRR